MSLVRYAGHRTWVKGARKDSGTLAQSAKPYQGLTLETVACLGLLALRLGIRIVGTSVL
ncbi:hypothetical protein [Microvirga ossetica]|uniref:hypothetical protein n=1 Tax=Microvirga ossetica TaxID=1882682 RepID=UPI0012FFD77F|nr:hypothetical protein [Microvirga ossetica]